MHLVAEDWKELLDRMKFSDIRLARVDPFDVSFGELVEFSATMSPFPLDEDPLRLQRTAEIRRDGREYFINFGVSRIERFIGHERHFHPPIAKLA